MLRLDWPIIHSLYQIIDVLVASTALLNKRYKGVFAIRAQLPFPNCDNRLLPYQLLKYYTRCPTCALAVTG